VIIPSIDISGGRTVQLVEGETPALEAGDPVPILERFSLAGEVAVIDIDAARGEGSNEQVIADLCSRGEIRVGGGIRDVDAAIGWLDRGAARVIVGTAATPELLAQLPRDRVIVALDAREGTVLSHGWRRSTGRPLLERIEELRGWCGGFLVTFVEREGHLGGTDLELANQVIAAAGPVRVTVAGGVSTAEEVAELDRLGADAQVGMALYTGRLGLAEAITAPLRSDRPDGLWPTVVVDEHGAALGLVYSSHESLSRSIDERLGVYQSRSRGVWVKGETSGATQELIRVTVDCDRDALRFTVRQHGPGFCHTGDRSCWGEDRGLLRLERRLQEIAASPTPSSNTVKLLADARLLAAKLREEAAELADADTEDGVVEEAADLLYMIMVRLVSAGVGLDRVAAALDARERKVTRRPMVAKADR
jgi:phosphoribosyl-ATP pyrophosphohydrolase